MRLRRLFFLVLILSISVGHSTEAEVTLEESLREALDNNPGILALQSESDAVSAAVLPGYVWPNPSLEVMWMNIPQGSMDPRDAGMKQYAVSQKIPFPAKQAVKGSQMAAMKDLVDAQSMAKINRILAETERAYWTVYRLNREEEILVESLILLDQLLVSARSRYATGTVPQAEVLRAQLARSEIEVKLASYAEKREASRIELAFLMGRQTSDSLQLPADIPIQFSQVVDSFQSSPLIEVSHVKLRLASRMQTSAWLDALPDFMAAYRWRQDQEGEAGTSDIMLGVSLPIYVWPRSSNRIAAAGLEHKSALYDQQAVTNQVQATYVKLKAKITASREEIERIQNEVLPLAEQALASTRIAYETGIVEFNTLLETEKSWQEARMSLEASRYEYQSALADLRALAGEYEIDQE